MNAIAQQSAASLSGSKLDNRRMLAALIDLAIVGVGGAAILVAGGVVGGDGAAVGAPLAAVVLCWALYYYFACESGGGQTLGKRVTNLRVVRVDGSAAGMREIAIRTALRVVDTALVGLIAMLATGERRGRLGDLAAETMIVATDATEAAPTAAPAQAAAARRGVATPLPEVPAPAAATPLPELPDPATATFHPVAPAPVEVTPLPELPAPAEATPLSELPAPAPGEATPLLEVSAPAEATPPGDAPAVPELRPFEALAEAAAETAERDGEPVVELSVVEEPPVELSVVESPSVDAPLSDVPPSSPEDEALDLTTPSLKELARDVAAASDWRRAELEPVEEAEPEPVAEVEPVVELEPEPVAEAEPVVEAEGPDVTVRSVETVSAIDLVMGDQESPQDPPAGDDPSAGAA